ncbi:MAG: hypothetical protein ACFFEF_08955 [Candidatus Thorarchaeota archaeon]
MMSKRMLIGMLFAGLLIFNVAPRFASADITGNVYAFGATWLDQSYQIDNTIIQQETHQGNLQITVNNITPGDDYEYTYIGFNHRSNGAPPYYHEQNGTVDFQANQVYFALDTEDDDEDGLAESVDLTMYPSFNYHLPGHFFFVNPTWSTHSTDWNPSVDDAESAPGVQQLTESSGDGSFQLRIVIDYEYSHPNYGDLNGTHTITFSASYDSDGVLSTWSLEETTSAQNENHTVAQANREAYSRGTVVGAVSDMISIADIGLVTVVGVVGIIVGVLIGKKYWG